MFGPISGSHQRKRRRIAMEASPEAAYMALGVVLRDKKRLLEIGHRIGIGPTLVVAAQQQSLRIS